MSIRLSDLTWRDLDGSPEDAVLAVPVGSTEQHGPHLPLSTDTDIAVALAEGLARRRRAVLVAPPVAYGSSGEHDGFGGTLSIGQEATEVLLVELCRSATATFGRVLLLSAHGGNERPVARAERLLRSEGRDVLAFFPRWRADAHAGRAETSIMLALHPERVRACRAEQGAAEPLDELMPRLIARGVRDVSPNGVLGDPTGASAAEGRALLDRGLDELVSAVGAWDAARPEASRRSPS